MPLLRRFLVETRVAGGAWLVARDATETAPRRYACRHRDVTGYAPDALRPRDVPERLARIPKLKTLAIVVEAASGRGDSWAPDQRTDDAVAAVACAAGDGSCRVFAVAGRSASLPLACGAAATLVPGEAALLRAVERHVRDVDPDALFAFDNRGLGLFAERYRLLCKRGARFGRFDDAPLACDSVTTWRRSGKRADVLLRRGVSAAGPRRRRGCHVETPRRSRSDAAGAPFQEDDERVAPPK